MNTTGLNLCNGKRAVTDYHLKNLVLLQIAPRCGEREEEDGCMSRMQQP